MIPDLPASQLQDVDHLKYYLLPLSGRPNDQIFPCSLNNFFDHGLKLVDLQDALHLQEPPVDQTNITSRDTNNGVDCLLRGPILIPSSDTPPTPPLSLPPVYFPYPNPLHVSP